MSQSNYKESNILFVGKIPSDWIVRSMRSLFTFGRGRVISNEEIADNVGEYPVYSSQTKNEGVLGYINTYDFNGEYVTWTTDGANAGTVFYREGKFNCTNVCGTIQPKKEGVVYLKLLPYYLNFATKEYVRYDINPKLMNNVMGDIPICFPESYSEQKYIVDYLDEQTSNINSIIAKNEELIRLLEEKRLSLINQVITKGLDHNVPMKDSGVEWIGEIPEHWDVINLKKCCETITDGSHFSPETTSEGKYYITVRDVGKDSIDFDNAPKISVEDYNTLKRNGCEPKKGDVLLSKDGTIGKCIIVNETDFVILSSLGLLRPNNLIESEYLRYYLLSDINVKQMYSHIRGSAIKRLTISIIKELLLICPPLNEQEDIINYLNPKISRINNTINKIQDNINLLEEYKTSLIHHVVTGKIDVRGEEI